MRRSKWHELVIVLALVVFAGLGVAAIWGRELSARFGGAAPSVGPADGSGAESLPEDSPGVL